MKGFSRFKEEDQNIGELVLEILLNYSVDFIIDLNLGDNESWFKHPGNIDLLNELISRQTCLQIIYLSYYEYCINSFSSNDTRKLLTKIADVTNSI